MCLEDVQVKMSRQSVCDLLCPKFLHLHPAFHAHGAMSTDTEPRGPGTGLEPGVFLFKRD